MEILTPSADDVIGTPESVRLRGEAFDDVDGEITDDDAFVWSSDVDGRLGRGATLTTELSVGRHELELVVEDAAGNAGRARVVVEVTDDNTAPVPSITTPLDGALLREGSPLSLVGGATDAEDGTLTGPSLRWTSSLMGVLGTGVSVAVPTPVLGEHVIVLTATDSQGASANTAITVTVAGIGQNVPPQVVITGPTDGASLTAGASVALTGTATDPEDGALTGSSLVWTSDVDGALGTGTSTSAALSAGVHTLTLTATDGDGADGTDTVVVTANPAGGNQAPTAAITAPTAGATSFAGDVVALRGTGTDPEDGALTGASLVWTSSLDGALGTGASLDVPLDTEGTHTLTLVVTDADGAIGAASRTVYVLAANDPPSATITSPASGTRVTAGNSVSLVGSASDPEDGALTGGSLVWTSSLDGALGTGGTLATSSLGVGTHRITLTASDSRGALATDDIQLIVDPASTNVPPVARVSAPSTGSTGVSLSADGTASTDSDGTITGWSFDWGDGSPDSTGSATASHTYGSAGTYTVTLTVTDDDSATDTDTATVVVSVPGRVPVVLADEESDLGRTCAIAKDGADRLYVAYTSTQHGHVRLVRQNGASWTTETIEGPGFNIGGLADGPVDVAVDGSGDVHVAYLLDNELHYARRTSGSGVWTLEVVEAVDVDRFWPIAIALDPSAASRPTIAWTESGHGDPTVSFRTGPGAWTTESWVAPTSQQSGTRGGLAFSAAGVATLTIDEDYATVLRWSDAGGFTTPTRILPSYYGNQRTREPIALDLLGNAHVMGIFGLVSWTGTVWEQSDVANGDLDDVGVAWDTTRDEPVIAFDNRQGELELQRPVTADLWDWEYQGTADDSTLDLLVDSDGDARACFFRSGNLLVY